MTELYPLSRLQHNFGRTLGTMANSRAVHNEVARRLTDRLADMKRPFPLVLDLGSGAGSFAPHMAEVGLTPDSLIHTDIIPALLTGRSAVGLSAESPLPFANGTFDLIISNLMLHWVNNVPQALMHIGRALKPDGLFLASTLGNNSFTEFKTAFDTIGSHHAHVIPLTDVQSAGAALQKVGFAMPVVDRDVITVTYPDFTALYEDIKNTGSRNLHPNRARGLMTPRTLKAMETVYTDMFALPDGKLPVTLEVLYLHGWRPHSSQQKPLKPGTATVDLSEVLKSLPSRRLQEEDSNT